MRRSKSSSTRALVTRMRFATRSLKTYRATFAANVDKALLAGGRAMAELGGGTVLAPIEIYLAGRAISEVGNATLPISEIAIKGSRAWLHANLHALDVERHVRIHNLVRPGSHDLRTPVNLLAGTTILAGTNTYTGGTTINGGTLAEPSASE